MAELISDNEQFGRPANLPLVAEDCDLLDPSGLVDPLPDLDDEARSILGDPNKLFVNVTSSLKAIPRIRRSDLAEYCKLVVRQLKCSKVELSAVAYSGAGVFPVGKKNGRCREVWNCYDLPRLRPSRHSRLC